MIDRETEKLFPVLEELGVTLVAFTPLAKGFLSGRYQERPQFDHPEDNRSGQFQFFRRGLPLLPAGAGFDSLHGGGKGATMAQVCLAWMIRKKP